MNILSFGEILWDIIDDQAYIGGAPLNFAAHCAQLGQKASIASAVGADELGDEALRRIEELAVGRQFIQVNNDHPTGTVQVELKDGQPSYELVKDVAYDHIDANHLDVKELGKYQALYFGTLIQRSERSREALYHVISSCSFDHVFCDLNLRPGCYTDETIQTSLEHCTILKVNEDETKEVAARLCGSELSISDFRDWICGYFPLIQILIVTKGKDGCIVFDKNTDIEIAAEPCELKDAIGAGDAFSATFLSGYLNGKSIDEAARKANKVGAFVAASEGAIPRLPKSLLD